MNTIDKFSLANAIWWHVLELQRRTNLAKCKAWQKKHSEKYKAARRRRYRENGGLEKQLKWQRANRNKVREWQSDWREKHREHVRKSYRDRYHARGYKARVVSTKARRRKENPSYKLAEVIRSRITGSLMRAQHAHKSQNTELLLGCSFEFARAWIEKQFKRGMSWGNHGEWHIDHILPCASFDLTKPEHQRQCFHYTNLRPLWAVDNLSKGDAVVPTTPELPIAL